MPHNIPPAKPGFRALAARDEPGFPKLLHPLATDSRAADSMSTRFVQPDQSLEQANPVIPSRRFQTWALFQDSLRQQVTETEARLNQALIARLPSDKVDSTPGILPAIALSTHLDRVLGFTHRLLDDDGLAPLLGGTLHAEVADKIINPLRDESRFQIVGPLAQPYEVTAYQNRLDFVERGLPPLFRLLDQLNALKQTTHDRKPFDSLEALLQFDFSVESTLQSGPWDELKAGPLSGQKALEQLDQTHPETATRLREIFHLFKNDVPRLQTLLSKAYADPDYHHIVQKNPLLLYIALARVNFRDRSRAISPRIVESSFKTLVLPALIEKWNFLRFSLASKSFPQEQVDRVVLNDIFRSYRLPQTEEAITRLVRSLEKGIAEPSRSKAPRSTVFDATVLQAKGSEPEEHFDDGNKLTEIAWGLLDRHRQNPGAFVSLLLSQIDEALGNGLSPVRKYVLRGIRTQLSEVTIPQGANLFDREQDELADHLVSLIAQAVLLNVHVDGLIVNPDLEALRVSYARAHFSDKVESLNPQEIEPESGYATGDLWGYSLSSQNPLLAATVPDFFDLRSDKATAEVGEPKTFTDLSLLEVGQSIQEILSKKGVADSQQFMKLGALLDCLCGHLNPLLETADSWLHSSLYEHLVDRYPDRLARQIRERTAQGSVDQAFLNQVQAHVNDLFSFLPVLVGITEQQDRLASFKDQLPEPVAALNRATSELELSRAWNRLTTQMDLLEMRPSARAQKVNSQPTFESEARRFFDERIQAFDKKATLDTGFGKRQTNEKIREGLLIPIREEVAAARQSHPTLREELATLEKDISDQIRLDGWYNPGRKRAFILLIARALELGVSFKNFTLSESLAKQERPISNPRGVGGRSVWGPSTQAHVGTAVLDPNPKKGSGPRASLMEPVGNLQPLVPGGVIMNVTHRLQPSLARQLSDRGPDHHGSLGLSRPLSLRPNPGLRSVWRYVRK